MTTSPGDVNKKAGKAMGAMEDTLSDLQDEVAVAKKPPRNHFKPGWLFIAVAVAALVGGGTFFVAMELAKVNENSQSIDGSCEARNQALALINEKFEQLNVLIVARLQDRPDGTPNPPDVLAAFEKLRTPIPLKECPPPPLSMK